MISEKAAPEYAVDAPPLETTEHAAEFDRHHKFGTDLGGFNDRYFSNPAHARAFADAVSDEMEQERLELPSTRRTVILGSGSGPGMPEIMVAQRLKAMGKNPAVVLTDVVSEAMEQHYPDCSPDDIPGVPFYRVTADNRDISENEALRNVLEEIDGKVRVVVMRSVLHFEPTRAEQVNVLDQFYELMTRGAVLLNQEQAFDNADEANLAAQIRHLIGKRTRYLTDADFQAMMRECFDEAGTATPGVPPFRQTGHDFKLRYGMEDCNDPLYQEVMAHLKRRKAASETIRNSTNWTINGKTWNRATASKLMYGYRRAGN